jgi:hypothetical protein
MFAELNTEKFVTCESPIFGLTQMFINKFSISKSFKVVIDTFSAVIAKIILQMQT